MRKSVEPLKNNEELIQWVMTAPRYQVLLLIQQMDLISPGIFEVFRRLIVVLLKAKRKGKRG